MKVYLENGDILDTPTDMQLNITHNNPLLQGAGTYTLPVLLPETKRNLRLLKNPDRLDRKYRLLPNQRAYIQQGAIQYIANMNIEFSGDEGIDTVFMMNESEMYVKMNEMKDTPLSMAFVGQGVRGEDVLPDQEFDNNLDRLIRYVEYVMVGEIPGDFGIFRIATNYSDKVIDGTWATINYMNLNCLNDPQYPPRRTDNTSHTDITPGGITFIKLAGREARKIAIEDEEIEVSKGYGITPFLKEAYIIRRIFKYFGYELKESAFDTHPQLREIVVMNKTADALVSPDPDKARIDYAQLVPDCTISEYLKTVRADYGCEFFMSPDHRSVEVRFWNDVLDIAKNMKKDYSKKLGRRPKTQFSRPATLRSRLQRGIEFTQMQYETIQQLEASHGTLTYVQQISQGPGASEPDGIYFDQSSLDVWERYSEVFEETGNMVQKWRFLCRGLFDHYIDKEDVEYKDIDNLREYVPQIYGRYYYTHFGPDDQLVQTYNRIQLLYVGKRKHYNTTLTKKIPSSTGDEEVEDRDSSEKCPIMKAFRHLEIQIREIENIKKVFTSGSMYNYDQYGKPVVEGGFDLIPGGKYGLHPQFSAKYDNMLLSSFDKVSVPLNLTEADIVSYAMHELVWFDNQPLLPETLEYTLSDNTIKVHQATFRTIREYEDEET